MNSKRTTKVVDVAKYGQHPLLFPLGLSFAPIVYLIFQTLLIDNGVLVTTDKSGALQVSACKCDQK